ncbi:MAG: GIY-YIG nuclease family protein [Candidatus Sungiibacteriota bacterium]|uniref:GIY-YIG nuclease family protein n=1 Tax=Candidatus Sungiibacteriota bacterium TaxID=2750080 RepID=A0A7T5RJN8_9BACT|nr:MAG: GIY-YIG nuclease family protein [Candidatus Sungbacteria bacterium]
MYYIYITKSLKDGSLYKGFTEDLKERLKVHNQGGDDYTSRKRPWKLVWYCTFNDKKKALAFEKYLKSGSGRAFLKRHLL